MMALSDLYNFCRFSTHGPKKSGPLFDFEDPMPGPASSPTSFYAGELQRALKEQAFGIKAFTMGATSSQQATASVVLLEGHHLVIQLTTQGYTITNSSSASTGARVYETVDDLLQLSSPMYVKKRQETLMAALAKLS